jgi:hypothetical protein
VKLVLQELCMILIYCCVFYILPNTLFYSCQEVVQSVGTMLNEAKVTSLNPPPPSCADMSKKKKKTLFYRHGIIIGGS